MKKLISVKSASPLAIDEAARRRSAVTLTATFVLPSLVVIGLLFALIAFRGGIEAGVARLARWLPLGYAFSAGMVASVNPCGILMLPSYVLQQIRDEGDQASAGQRVGRALGLAVAVTSGFLVVFASVGGVIALGGQWLVTVFPYLGVIVGVALIGLGVWTLVTDQTLGIVAGRRMQARSEQGLRPAFAFGIAYAAGSLSCTLPIFLVVVGTSLAGTGPVASYWQFVGYALGRGTIIVAVTLGAVLFRRAVTRWLRLIAPYIHRVGALFLVGAGVYLVYYWGRSLQFLI